MTVSTELSHEEYVGNGVTTDFDFRFRIFEGKHLIVVVADSDGNETTLKNGTDYTIVGAGSYHGGKVVLNKPLAQGWKILLERDLPVVQETDLRNQGKFFAEVHEDAFDYLTMLIQKALGTFSLSLRKPTYLSNYYDAKGNRIANLAPPKFGSDSANKDYVDNSIKDIDSKTLRVKDKPINVLPNTEQRANKILAFDNNGQPITVLPESGSASDVLMELGKPSGANLIGISNGNTLQQYLDNGFLYPELYFTENETDHTYAFIQMFNDAKVTGKRIYANGEYNLYDQNRSRDGYENWMSYNHIIEINGFNGGIDLSLAKVNIISDNSRITAFKLINCSGDIKLPFINGNMQNLSMPSMYIDDCGIRIGAKCKNLNLTCGGIDHYPGHGIVVRHYIQDDISNLDNGIPENIKIYSCVIKNCWQSGIVPITGERILIIENSVTYSGSSDNKNMVIATVGHGIHTEPVVSTGGVNGRLRNVYIANNKSSRNRMHGLMCHSYIENFAITRNDFSYNYLDGAHYEAWCHSVISNDNFIKNNIRYGIYFNCTSPSAYPDLIHDASFNDTIEMNGSDGFIDFSGSKDLIISGSVGFNSGHGLTLNSAGQHTLSNLTLYNNGKGSSEMKYAINGSSFICNNIRIYNTSPSSNYQRAIRFRGKCSGSGIKLDENSTRFDVLDGHPLYCIVNDGKLVMQGDIGSIVGNKLILNKKSSGVWLMPDSFEYISISFSSSAVMSFPSPTLNNLGLEFIVDILAGDSSVFVVPNGTVNNSNQATASPNKKYRLKYTTTTNLSVVEI
ncbi:hypothetical protein ABN220_01375 [Proteus cibi]|uniref:hypothetical protein n=1 Tax=Proteus cibi TaxID=2050966 RepID=UPI0032DA8340